MRTEIYRVISCSDVENVQKQDGTQSTKRQIRLQEIGGYSRSDDPEQFMNNSFAATLFGNLSKCMFYPNDLVLCTLRPSIRKYQGQWYQDLMVTDIYKLNH